MKKRAKPRLRDVDALFSKFIRLRDGECQATGWREIECNGSLQAAHVISRRYHGVRYAPLNCWALCQAHHLYETNHPLEGHDFWNGLLGEAVFDALRDKAIHHRGVLDLAEIAAGLRVKIKTLEEAA